MIMQQKINDISLRKWFSDRPALRLTILEEEANIPSRTLQRFIDGRQFPEKHIDSLVLVLKKYGY